MTNWTDYTNFFGIQIQAAGGTVDALTATYTPFTLADKMIVCVVPAGANTVTTPTFAANGGTARTIVRDGGFALFVGDLFTNKPALLQYNLANTRWELMNPQIPATQDSNASHLVGFKGTSNVTAARLLNYAGGDADRTMTLAGNLTTTGGDVTLPTGTYGTMGLQNVAAMTAAPIPSTDNSIALGDATHSWANVFLTKLTLKGQELQSFLLVVDTSAGSVVSHSTYCHDDQALLPTFCNKITGASVTDTVTPTGSDSSTAFAAGWKKSSANTNVLIANTASQTHVDAAFALVGPEWMNDGTTGYRVQTFFRSYNVNGVTRTYLCLGLTNALTGAAVAWGATASKSVRNRFFGYLA